MELIKEYGNYIYLVLVLISSILALVLTSSTKGYVGKPWLVSATVFTLIVLPGSLIISIVAQHSPYEFREIYSWYDLVRLFGQFGTVCLGLFFFSLWKNNRMNFTIKDFLFSFQGRIPRSAFWIAYCILLPIGLYVGLSAATSEAQGIIKIIIWIIYIAWIFVSGWISLAIYAKRWHDCGKSGWMTAIIFIPIIGAFWLIIYLGFIKGTVGTNVYGEDSIIVNKEGITTNIENA
jgi:uncharacterized membrane protein YhaH (DUF805 family)